MRDNIIRTLIRIAVPTLLGVLLGGVTGMDMLQSIPISFMAMHLLMLIKVAAHSHRMHGLLKSLEELKDKLKEKDD